MPRIRTIKPEFPQSESIGRLTRDARLLFIQLFTIADDLGRCRAANKLLSSQLYPYDDDAAALISGWLLQLQENKLIQLYEVDGNSYLQIVNWSKHQRIDNAGKSNFPEPPNTSRREPPRTAASDGNSPLDLGEDLGKGIGEDKDNLGALSASDLDKAVEMYNQLAEEKALSKVQRMTEPRKKALRKRLTEAGGLDGWAYAISQVRESKFLTGKNDRGWRADLDFMLQASSFTKIMEGRYRNGSGWDGFVGPTNGKF